MATSTYSTMLWACVDEKQALKNINFTLSESVMIVCVIASLLTNFISPLMFSNARSPFSAPCPLKWITSGLTSFMAWSISEVLTAHRVSNLNVSRYSDLRIVSWIALASASSLSVCVSIGLAARKSTVIFSGSFCNSCICDCISSWICACVCIALFKSEICRFA